MRGHAGYSESTFGDPQSQPLPALTAMQRADIEAQRLEDKDRRDRVYDQLRLDSQATARAMENCPLFAGRTEWNDIVWRSLDDYRSGRSLMTHLGAARLVDPATTGMLLAVRRGLIEETGATTMSELVLIDIAVTAFANAMRIQATVGNTALLLEAEMFGQPGLQAKWTTACAGRSEKIRGLAVDEHVALLRDRLMPLVERFHRLGRESVEAFGRIRQAPSPQVEQAGTIEIVLI